MANLTTISPWVPETFCWKYNKFKVTWVLSENNFPNTSSGQVQCSIDNIAEISVKNKKNLRPESENRKKTHTFSGKNCPKNSSIHEERAFDKMTRTFWLKIRKFTHRIPTKRKRKFCRKINSRRCSSERLECSFGNKIGKLLPKSGKKFVRNLVQYMKLSYSWKLVIL